MILSSPWINNRLGETVHQGARPPWAGPVTDIVTDPFAILRAAYDWDAFFVPESGAYTDLAETTAATDGTDIYRWVNSKGLSLRFTQATAGNRPTYTANAIGTRAGMVFSGTDTMTYASNVLLTGDHFLFGVFKYSSNGVNAEGPIKTRNADGGDDRVILLDGVFSGAQQRWYTTPVYDYNPPTTGKVFGFDCSVASGAAWENTTKTAGRNVSRTNIDQLEIRPAAAFPTLTVGAIGYILKSKLTGGDTDILAIINSLKTLYGI